MPTAADKQNYSANLSASDDRSLSTKSPAVLKMSQLKGVSELQV